MTAADARDAVRQIYPRSYAQQFKGQTRWYIASEPSGFILAIAGNETEAWVAAAAEAERLQRKNAVATPPGRSARVLMKAKAS